MKNMRAFSSSQTNGFTLVELLIVIAIIAIIAAVTFVALNPLGRFQDARDSSRWSDISALLTAIKVSQIDNRGTYIGAITSTNVGEVYMIGTGTTGCDSLNAACGVSVTDDDNCIDLTVLATDGYLGEIPVSPTGVQSWSATYSGYTLSRNTNGSVTLRACEAENSSAISLTR